MIMKIFVWIFKNERELITNIYYIKSNCDKIIMAQRILIN